MARLSIFLHEHRLMFSPFEPYPLRCRDVVRRPGSDSHADSNLHTINQFLGTRHLPSSAGPRRQVITDFAESTITDPNLRGQALQNLLDVDIYEGVLLERLHAQAVGVDPDAPGPTAIPETICRCAFTYYDTTIFYAAISPFTKAHLIPSEGYYRPPPSNSISAAGSHPRDRSCQLAARGYTNR